MIKKYFKKNNKLATGFTPTPKIFGVSLRGKRGFTLVETLIAISIFSVSIVSMMSVLGGGVSDINYAKSKMTAIYIAQEGIEYVRNQRDNYVLYNENGWEKFIESSPDIKCPDPSDTEILRTCDINTDINNEVKVSSDVFWVQKGVTHDVILTEDLFNWVE